MLTAWADGRDGLNNEHVLVSSSTNGTSWSAPAAIETAGDRGYYAAPALSPNGTDAYVVYNAFTTPFRDDTTSPRSLVGVVKHADVTSGGLGAWSTLNRGATGDPRGSSQNDLTAEFLGDYVYAVATRTYGAAVWNDARNAADCPAIDAWRMSLRTPDTSDDVPRPAPQQDCDRRRSGTRTSSAGRSWIRRRSRGSSGGSERGGRAAAPLSSLYVLRESDRRKLVCEDDSSEGGVDVRAYSHVRK